MQDWHTGNGQRPEVLDVECCCAFTKHSECIDTIPADEHYPW